MRHDGHHQELLACLVLGELSESETSEVAALLDSCDDCKREVEQYQRRLGPESPPKTLQLQLAFSGWHEDLQAAIASLLALLPQEVRTERHLVGSGAGGNASESILLLIAPDEEQVLLEALRRFFELRRSKHMSAEVMILKTPGTEGGHLIDVGALRLKGLAEFLRPIPE